MKGINRHLIACCVWGSLFVLPAIVTASELELYTGVSVDTRAQGYEYFGVGVGQQISDHWTSWKS